MKNREARQRRAKRTRLLIGQQEKVRLSVFKSARHIYAQVTTPDGSKVVASASSLEKGFREGWGRSTGNCEAAVRVGGLIAERLVGLGITEVAFDRSGYRYHGRVKALAEAAREQGLKF